MADPSQLPDWLLEQAWAQYRAQMDRYDWRSQARPEQLLPDEYWPIILVMAGRGYGKSKMGAEAIREKWKAGCKRMGIIAPTANDLREVAVEGESGILAAHPPMERPTYISSKRRLEWPDGAIASLFTGEEPDRLRGPQHEFIWCFTTGTRITLPDGSTAPIESLNPSDRVLTRTGSRPIRDTGERSAQVGTVHFSDGRSLTGTADHPVLTYRGWTKLADLKQGDRVCAISASTGVESAGTSTSTATTSTEGLEATTAGTETGFIERFIATTLDRSQRAWRSITSTATPKTTIPATSSCSLQPSTAGATWKRIQFPSLIGVPSRLLRGLAKTAAGRSTGRHRKRGCVVPNAAGEKDTKKESRGGPAPIAESPSSAAMGSFVVSVASTWEAAGLDTVHNISVEGQPEFFANGILVHNCDEFAACKYPEEVFNMAMLGLRLGQQPQALITTTPRPIPIMRRLQERENVLVRAGSTYENLDNLAPTFREQILEEYAGTRLERQEILGELIEEVEGALWSYQQIDQQRISESPADLDRIVVGVDPPGSAGTECGIVAVGKRGTESYVLQDASMKGSPEQWARRAVQVYAKWGAHRIVAERNFGGDMVESTIRGVSRDVPVKLTTASRGKTRRAEPVAALYEQGRVFHVGRLPHLEDEMTTYIGDPKQKSPNRMDALVWAMTDLVVRRGGHRGVVWGRR